MSRLTFARGARVDLQEIHDYIAADNPDAAERVVCAIESRCRSIVDMPNSGRKREELKPGLRSVREGNFIILYLGTEDGVYIVRIIHSKRDIEPLLLDEA